MYNYCIGNVLPLKALRPSSVTSTAYEISKNVRFSYLEMHITTSLLTALGLFAD